MFIIKMSDNFLSPRSYQQHRQQCNYKIYIKISLICIVWYLLIFLDGNKSHFYTPNSSKNTCIFQANQSISIYRWPCTKTLHYPSPFYHLSIKWKKKKKKIVNILLNQSTNQYCYQANNVLEWKLMTFLRAPLINIHCIS